MFKYGAIHFAMKRKPVYSHFTLSMYTHLMIKGIITGQYKQPRFFFFNENLLKFNEFFKMNFLYKISYIVKYYQEKKMRKYRSPFYVRTDFYSQEIINSSIIMNSPTKDSKV